MSEATLTRSILRFLNSLDRCKAIKFKGSRYVEKGTPDIICSYHGRFYLFEVKWESNTSTEIQKLRQEEWTATDAKVYEVHSLYAVKKALGLTKPDPYLISKGG